MADEAPSVFFPRPLVPASEAAASMLPVALRILRPNGVLHHEVVMHVLQSLSRLPVGCFTVDRIANRLLEAGRNHMELVEKQPVSAMQLFLVRRNGTRSIRFLAAARSDAHLSMLVVCNCC
jgi:hypothetical protein